MPELSAHISGFASTGVRIYGADTLPLPLPHYDQKMAKRWHDLEYPAVGEQNGDSVRTFLDRLTHAVITDEADTPLYHAALGHYNGTTLVIPGASGAGKTTLALLLAQNGVGLLSDELIALSRDTIGGFNRPIHARLATLEVLKRCGPAQHNVLVTREGGYVNQEFMGQSTPRSNTITLLPAWSRDAQLRLEPISAAYLCQQMMAVCVNARNFADHALSASAHFARTTKAYRFHYNDPSAIAYLLEKLPLRSDRGNATS